MFHIRRTVVWMLIALTLVSCNDNRTPGVANPSPTVYVAVATVATTQTIAPIATPESTESPEQPACYLVTLPADFASSYAIQGWQEFASQINVRLTYFYFPEDCQPESLERDGLRILYGGLIPEDEVGLVILNPIDSGTLGVFYQHLIQHEYWQMGPEDYPALVDDTNGLSRNLVFLRVNELNGDNTIVGNPLTVLTSLAEHEYIHIAQSRNNPDLAEMVWSDNEYQAFIEGYANIGNVSSQRYYFETQAAIVMLQNLDLMNRSGELQDRIASALKNQGSDVPAFLAVDLPVYDRHVQAFFLRVGGQAYVDGLRQGEISPYALFTRAGCGDLTAYHVILEIFK
jgi:hypothetical protein